MSVQAPKGVALSADDRGRMERLSEEVQGRLKEMALITARTLGVKLDPGAVPIYDPTHHGEATEADETIEVVVVAVPQPDGHFKFYCYQDPPGICVEC